MLEYFQMSAYFSNKKSAVLTVSVLFCILISTATARGQSGVAESAAEVAGTDSSVEKTSPETAPAEEITEASPAAIPAEEEISADLSEELDPTQKHPFKSKTINNKEKSGYTLNLQDLIKKSKENIKEVNQKIAEQAVKRRNMLREEKAREYFERAQALLEEGKFRESRAEYEKAIKITEHPEMKNYVRVSPQKFKKQNQALSRVEAQEERDFEAQKKTSATGTFRKVTSPASRCLSRRNLPRPKTSFCTSRRSFRDIKRPKVI